MVDRKRLIELLRVPLYPRIKAETAEEVADYLIDNDIVTVVRCKDCKYWNNGGCYRLELSRPDDFCSYGEKKEE